MMPRRITDLEQEYDRTFPGNPATLFHPGTDREASFFDLLRRAVDRGVALTRQDLIHYLGGEERYRGYVDYYAGWGIEITWPKKA